jgi:hypothetical protein
MPNGKPRLFELLHGQPPVSLIDCYANSVPSIAAALAASAFLLHVSVLSPTYAGGVLAFGRGVLDFC